MNNTIKLFVLAEEIGQKLLDQEISGSSVEIQQVMNDVEKKILDLKTQMEELQLLNNKLFTSFKKNENISNERAEAVLVHLSRCIVNYNHLEKDFSIQK